MVSELRDISFIIIACNEQVPLKKCLDVFRSLSLNDCEFILVDSGSTDQTLSLMIEYSTLLPNVKVFHIKGLSNAAIARNIGIREAHCKYIFFLDGDFELDHNFIFYAIKKLKDGVCEGVVGGLNEIQYTPDFTHITKDLHLRSSYDKEERAYSCGGSFIANLQAVKKVGFFDELFFRSQDIEFTLRFSRFNRLLSVKTPIMGIHHTVPYDNLQRTWSFISSFSYCFYGEIIKRNLFHNPIGLLYFLKQTLLGVSCGFFLILVFIIILLFNFMLGIYTISMVLVLDIIFGLYQQKGILSRLWLHYIAPFFIIMGFFYYPKKTFSYKVVQVLKK